MSQIPLNAAASIGDNNRQVTSSLPPEVIQCLENARFLHLATCTDNIPNVSLMNYTYLPSSPYSPSEPVIVMTTNPASKKMANLTTNPHVSLLVHDWVSHRPPTTNARRLSGGASSVSPNRSSLASLLLNLNTSAMSSISATINGSARVVDAGTDEERFYRQAHLDNNTFDDDAAAGFNPFGQPGGGSARAGGADGAASGTEDGGRCFVAGEEVRVIIVAVKGVRISDWKGNVKDWELVRSAAGDQQPVLVNGIS